MTDNVVHIVKDEGQADQLLDDCKGAFRDVLLIGYDSDGQMRLYATPQFSDGGNLLWALEVAKTMLMNGELMGE